MAVAKFKVDRASTNGNGHIAPAPVSIFPLVYLMAGVTAQVMDVTPETAAQWLQQRMPRQRKIRKMHLKALLSDLEDDRWHLTFQPIIFDSAGWLMDGQHRLTACIETGVTIRVLVIMGVDSSAFPAMDITAKRTCADQLNHDGVSFAVLTSAAANLIDQYEDGRGLRSNYVLSPVKVKQIVEAHPDLPASAMVGKQCVKLFRNGAVPTFLHYVFSRKHPDKAQEFFDRLITGEMLAKGNPIYAMRQRLINGKFARPELLILTIKAWNAYVRGESIQLLRIYEGEEIPEIL